MNSSDPYPSSWFSPDKHRDLLDFWAVYETHYEAIQASTTRMAASHKELGPILRTMSAEQRELQNTESRDRLRRAIAGDWAQYEESLRQQGMMYARLGLSFQAWYDVTRAFHGELVPLLVEAYGTEAGRLTRSLLALQEFVDRAMALIAEQYLLTKEQMIREVQAQHTMILDASLDPIVAMDERGVVIEFNPAAERTFGYAREDAIGKVLEQLIVPERFRYSDPVGLASYRETGEGGVVGKRIELGAMRADRSELTVEVAIVATRAADGHRTFTGYLRDLTETKRAQRSQALWTHVFEKAEFGIVVLDASTREVRNVNEAFARMMGGTPGELLGRTFNWHASTATFETTLTRADGTAIPVLISSSVIGGDGGAELLVATAVDITERKELELARARSAELREQNRRIEEASRLKSEFLANMSHELRTPLNSIIGFSELLHHGEVGPLAERQQEFLGDILTSGRHLLQLINDILDLSKVEAGKMEFHPAPMDVERTVSEVTSILRSISSGKNVRIETHVSPEIKQVVLDAARFKQVLYNYLSNALKFTPDGGRVLIRALPAGAHHLRVEVEDTGVGIAPDDVTRLFVEFQQLESGAAKKHGGTGLGLALTKRLVEAQGGSVGVESRLGEGSLFYAILPRRSESNAVLPKQLRLEGAPGSPTVLVVEDDPKDQQTIMRTLIDAGYAVEVAATGATAIEMCRAKIYDAITLDLILPDTSGLDVLRVLRTEGKNQSVPVVVITVVAEKVTAGFVVHDVLAKPVDGRALLASLRGAEVAPGTSGAVVVIDDDPGSLKLMATALEQLGYRAVCHENGESALVALGTERPLAVILDLLMPGMDGFEFLARFRQSATGNRIPILVWTIKDLSRSELARLRSSAHAILQKGTGSSELTASLRSFLPSRGVVE